MSGPRASQRDIVLPVKEVGCWMSVPSAQVGTDLVQTCVSGIQCHRLEFCMLLQHRAGPFPHSTQVRLTAERIALVCDRDWMPVLESHISLGEVDKKAMWIKTSCCAGVAVQERG